MGGQKKLIIGNWKMHFSIKQSANFAKKLADKILPPSVGVVVAPTSISLPQVAETIAGSKLQVAAQNAYGQDEGAFTGEISMPMLRGLAKYVIIGHSERRHIFQEDSKTICEKVAAAIRSGLVPVLCIGETLIERQSGQTNQVIREQIISGVANLTNEEVAKMVIAYEPVWAIGTGEFAGPADVKKAAQRVRSTIASLYGGDTADSTTVLYGGSVNKDNALSYTLLEGVDGLLVGGASLSVATFWPIVERVASALPKKINITTKKDAK